MVILVKVNEHKGAHAFYYFLTIHCLFPVTAIPPRFTSISFTLIDNIITNVWPPIMDFFIISSAISDHLPVLARFDFEATRYGNSSSQDYRLISDEGIKVLGNTLSISVTGLMSGKRVVKGRLQNRVCDLLINLYEMPIMLSFV